MQAAAAPAEDASKKKDSGKEDAVIPYDSDFTIGVDKIAEAMGAGWNVGNQLEANSGGKVNETVWAIRRSHRN